MRYILYTFLIVVTTANAADKLAVCNTKLSGYAYYPSIKPNSNTSAIEADGIKNFSVTVMRTADGKYDVLYIDRTNSIKSATQKGGKVYLIRKGKRDFTILVDYPGERMDIYTFSKENNRDTVSLLINSSGDLVMFPKNSLLVGECQLTNIP